MVFWCADVKNKKKYYFNIFLNKKYFKNNIYCNCKQCNHLVKEIYHNTSTYDEEIELLGL